MVEQKPFLLGKKKHNGKIDSQSAMEEEGKIIPKGYGINVHLPQTSKQKHSCGYEETKVTQAKRNAEEEKDDEKM